jgi:hypothetical protein
MSYAEQRSYFVFWSALMRHLGLDLHFSKFGQGGEAEPKGLGYAGKIDWRGRMFAVTELTAERIAAVLDAAGMTTLVPAME